MDDQLSRVTIDPLAIRYPSRGETASANAVGNTVGEVIGDAVDRIAALESASANAVDRIAALESAPAGGGNYDVAVTTALVAGDVGKVVVVAGGTATLYQGGAIPSGVLVSVDGAGGGVVRRWGEAVCQFGLGLPAPDALLKADPATSKVVSASLGDFAVFGRVLSYDGGGTGTVFVMVIATFGMQAAS